MTTPTKRLAGMVLAVILVLLVPFTAMQFTETVTWTPFDFAVAAVLLLGTGLAVELVIRKVRHSASRIAVCASLLTALGVIWLELAVGILGTPFGGS